MSYVKPKEFSLGRLGRPHGVRGMIKAYLDADFEDLVEVGSTLVLQLPSGQRHALVVSAVQASGKEHLLGFEGITQPEQWESYRQAELLAPTAWLDELERDGLFDFEWIGFQVFDAAGQCWGQVQGVIYTPLQQWQVLCAVGPKKGQLVLIPVVDDWMAELKQDEGVVVWNGPWELFEL